MPSQMISICQILHVPVLTGNLRFVFSPSSELPNLDFLWEMWLKIYTEPQKLQYDGRHFVC